MTYRYHQCIPTRGRSSRSRRAAALNAAQVARLRAEGFRGAEALGLTPAEVAALAAALCGHRRGARLA